MKKILLTSIFILTTVSYAQAQLSINEIMQSNVDCIMDDLNEFPDSWAELYNIGSNSENLASYKIGLTNNADEAWQLPDSLIKVGGAVLIYCDKSKVEAPSLHTNFRLEPGKGGAIYLFKNDQLIEKLENIKKQPAPNIAYGRLKEGSTIWGYQYIPTPNSNNCGVVCNDILDNPIFSVKGQVFEISEPMLLELLIPEGAPEGTVIRYTLDGSEPTEKSSLYCEAIRIDSNTVIRAKLFCNGYLSPRSVTNSYLFHGREITLPVISLVTDPCYLYDDKIGIYVEGNFEEGKFNYSFDWRRPINIEFFDASGDVANPINQLCEARIMGGASRRFNLKSIALYANKRFGSKRFNYEFFPDQKPGLNEFKSLILRNGGNDFENLHLRDVIVQQSVGKYVDLDWQSYLPVIFYVNGQYKGILNLRERSNEDYVWSNYDGLEDIDLIENNTELKEGDFDNYNNFQTFYSEKDHNLSEYAKWMDWEEYTNLMIMNIFYNNMDFPGNNIVAWRPKKEGSIWRFIAKDTDFGLGLYEFAWPSNFKTFEWLYNPDYDPFKKTTNKEEHTRLFRNLMEDDDYRREFIDRVCVYLGDFLTEEKINLLIDNLYEQIKTENPYHLKVNNISIDYEKELDAARKWIHERIVFFYEHMGSFFTIGEPIPMQINKDITNDQNLKISFNGVKLTNGNFDGKYYPGRPINLQGNVDGWRIYFIYDTRNETTFINGSVCNIEIPYTCKSVFIESLISSSSVKALNEKYLFVKHTNKGVLVEGLSNDTPISLFDISGRLLYTYSKSSRNNECELIVPHRGVYIIKYGEKKYKYASCY